MSVPFPGSVAAAIAEALEDLLVALERPGDLELMLRDLGWGNAVGASELVQFSGAVNAQVTAIRNAMSLSVQLDSASDSAQLELAGQLVTTAKSTLEAIAALGHTPPGGLPAPFDQPAFWEQLGGEFIDLLVFRWMQESKPGLWGLLIAMGVVDVTAENPSGTNRIPYIKRHIRWDRLPLLFGDQARLAREVFHWNDPGQALDFDRLLGGIEALFASFRFPTRRESPSAAELADFYEPSNPALPQVKRLVVPLVFEASADRSAYSEVGFSILPVPPASNRAGPPTGLFIAPQVQGPPGPLRSHQATAPLAISVKGGFSTQDIGTQVSPEGVSFKLASAGAPLDAEIALKAAPPTPWRLLGSEGSHRVELGAAQASLALKGIQQNAEVVIGAGVGGDGGPSKLAVIVAMGEADGFLQHFFGSEEQRFEFGGTLRWSSKTGVEFTGEAGITLRIPLNLDLGVIELESVTVVLGVAGSGARLAAGVTGKLTLGPAVVTVDGVGIALDLNAIPEGQPRGAFGSLEPAFGFKPPAGVGMALDAGVVKGGGYLFFDSDKAEYGGVLELSLESVVQLKAIALITTRLPDGSSGFSLLLILTAQFEPGIQLGFGFALTGVGGLAGVNRTMNTDILRSGLRNHALDSILFPPDPVANAPRIISDIRAVFPPAEGRYVFGPMLEVGWGTPTLISAELGVVLELPEPVRLAILGEIRSLLPSEELVLVELHLDVLGVVDFEAQSLSVDGTLYGSRVLAFSLDGDMALRLNWSADPFFALSVGGLHPRFSPPPGFPELRRCSLSLGYGDNPRLSCQSYWAITSNSVQFGARVELFASAAGFGVHGYLGFDVLIVLSPFSFEADMSAGVDLLAGGSVVMGIDLSFMLAGPTPWHARGTASVHVLFFSVSVDFDVSWGDDHPATLPAQDVHVPLLAALADARNWSAALPAGAELGASLRSVSAPEGTLLVHPLGRLTVKQRVVPLGMPIARFGSGTPDYWNKFEIPEVLLGAANTEATIAVQQDRFAPGQFEDLSDDQKLSAPAFQSMDAGVSFSSTDAKKGHICDAPVQYETIIVDDPVLPHRPVGQLYRPSAAAFAAHLGCGAAGLSQVLHTGNAKYLEAHMRGSVTAAEPSYTIASTHDLAEREDLLRYGSSQLGVRLALEEHLAAHPEDRGRLQVIPTHELAAG